MWLVDLDEPARSVNPDDAANVSRASDRLRREEEPLDRLLPGRSVDLLHVNEIQLEEGRNRRITPQFPGLLDANFGRRVGEGRLARRPGSVAALRPDDPSLREEDLFLECRREGNFADLDELVGCHVAERDPALPLDTNDEPLAVGHQLREESDSVGFAVDHVDEGHLGPDEVPRLGDGGLELLSPDASPARPFPLLGALRFRQFLLLGLLRQ